MDADTGPPGAVGGVTLADIGMAQALSARPASALARAGTEGTGAWANVPSAGAELTGARALHEADVT